MIRTLLTTTALAALLTTGALAQDAPAPAPSPMDVPSPARPITESTLHQPFTLSQGYVANPGDNLASRIMGAQVYSSSGPEAEVVGDVNDLVLDSDGGVAAVVVGVGGFLGVGEKNIAVDFSELQWSTGPDGNPRIILATSKDALTGAPDFVWPADDNAPTAPLNNDTAQQEENNLIANPNDTTNISPDMTTDQPVAPGSTVDRSNMTPLDEATLTADDVKGIGVFGENNEQIGTIGDLVVNADGKIDAVIVDVGGFLGVGSKPVAVGFDNLQFSIDANNQRYLFLNATKAELEAQPQFNKDTYPTDRDAQRMVVNPNG